MKVKILDHIEHAVAVNRRGKQIGLTVYQIDVSHVNKALDEVAERLGGKVTHVNYGLEPGTIHEAERIPGTDKIKIL